MIKIEWEEQHTEKLRELVLQLKEIAILEKISSQQIIQVLDYKVFSKLSVHLRN